MLHQELAVLVRLLYGPHNMAELRLFFTWKLKMFGFMRHWAAFIVTNGLHLQCFITVLMSRLCFADVSIAIKLANVAD